MPARDCELWMYDPPLIREGWDPECGDDCRQSVAQVRRDVGPGDGILVLKQLGSRFDLL
jgi:hypothetical protein